MSVDIDSGGVGTLEAVERDEVGGNEVGRETVAAPAGLTAEQLARLRDTLVAANPGAVPELIAGHDFETLLASVAPAREAYGRIKEQALREAVTGVPRGGGVREPDPAIFADLAPEAKIALGLGKVDRR